jgi:putative tributyrin esterase
MAVSEIHFQESKAVGQMTSATVILPEGQPGPFPVLYLLHGLTDDHTAWVRRTSLERYVEKLPLIVVMPNGGRSFYVDGKNRPMTAYDTYIVKELAGFIDSTFQTVTGRRGRAIAGLSMGGYGALAIALKHPDMFCAAASHSGALAFCSRPLWKDKAWRTEYEPLFGRNPQGGPNDLFLLIRNVDRALLPALRIDCGRKDFLIEENRAFHRHLKRLKVPHVYREYPGQHEWAYWDEHIQDTLKFVMPELGR